MLWFASFLCILVACGRLHSQSLDRYEQRLKKTWGVTPSWERTHD
jgi:hypothetical protein